MANNIIDKVANLFQVVKLIENKELRNVSDLFLKIDELEKYAKLEADLNGFGIKFENTGTGELYIPLTLQNIGIKLFFDKKHFSRLCNKGILDNDFAILLFEDSYLVYKKAENRTFIGGFVVQDNNFVENARYYIDFLEVLQSDRFADYWDSAHQEIIISTLEKGVFKITYPAELPDIDVNFRLKTYHEFLLRIIDKRDYMVLFKNEIIDFLKTDNSIIALITKLKPIFDVTDRDYELLIKQFSFENFKNKLYSEKDKYFSSLRDLLSKILTQSISIPISISASIFVTYSLNSLPILLLILIAFSIYSFLYIHFQFLLLNDVYEIEADYIRDFAIIKEKSGLNKSDITKEESKIDRKIRTIKITIWILVLSVIILSISFVYYLLLQITITMSFKIIMVALLIAIFGLRMILN